jgi:hypothetical protein
METTVARTANEATVAPMVGSAFAGSLESGSQFCVGVPGTNLASVTVKKFPHLV